MLHLLNALRAFEVAARLGSVRKAAEELRVSDGAVSRHIKNLEDALGVALFERGNRSMRLTPAAAAFAATRPGHWKVDLYALARRRLQAAGLAPEAIHGGGLCTISDPARFYSHRRDQRTGRMATLVFMAPAAG